VSQPGELKRVFETYWDEMERCRKAQAYWSLLHVTVCLPDICAALQSSNGKTRGVLYIDWCNQYLDDSILRGPERYDMRCKILHQGRTCTDEPGRYTGFAFGQPSESGDIDHGRAEGTILHLDVGQLALEMRSAVESWIQDVAASPHSDAAKNVQQNLVSVVRITRTNVRFSNLLTIPIAKTTSI